MRISRISKWILELRIYVSTYEKKCIRVFQILHTINTQRRKSSVSTNHACEIIEYYGVFIQKGNKIRRFSLYIGVKKCLNFAYELFESNGLWTMA